MSSASFEADSYEKAPTKTEMIVWNEKEFHQSLGILSRV